MAVPAAAPTAELGRPIVVVFAILMLAIAITLGVVYAVLRADIRADNHEKLSVIAAYKAEEIQSWLRERRAAIEDLAASATFLASLQEALTAPSETARTQAADAVRARLAQMREGYHFQSLLLLDAHGKLLVGAGLLEPPTDATSLLVRAWEPGAQLHDFHRLPGAQSEPPIALGLFTGIRLQEPASRWILYARIDPQRFLYPLIQRFPLPSASAETLLVRREGDQVLFLNTLRHRAETALQLTQPLGAPDLPAARGLRGTEGVVQGLDYRGVPMLAVLTAIHGTSWVMVTKVDAREAEALLFRLATIASGVLGGFILTAGLLLSLWWRGQQQAHRVERLQHDLERQQLTQQFDFLSRYANDAILLIGADGQVQQANERALSLYGYDREALLRLHLEDLCDPSEHARVNALWNELPRPQAMLYETRHRRSDGTSFPVECSVRRMETDGGVVSQHIVRDISARKRAEEQIRQLAFYDPLTGLPNRRLLEEHLGTALAQAKRRGSCLAVIVLDLDFFKKVNDSLGHGVGDALLVEVAQRMRACLRASDMVARPGGDEFLLVLPEIKAKGAAQVAEKLIARISAPLHIQGHDLTIGCSLGIGLYPQNGQTASLLITRADTAMYRAKQSGRNRYQFFTDAMQREALRVMTVEQQLRHAIRGGELRLHYQPQVELASGRAIGLEALVRWAHPDKGLLGPAAFIPLAETSDLIQDLGAWVLQAVAEQLQTWLAAGLEPLPVAVNVSARQLRHREQRRALSEKVHRLLAEHHLAPALLELELTENSLLEEREEIGAVLEELRALGVRLSLDDFGTGYSSLRYLESFPLDRLKIDQSFVRAAPEHSTQAAIVETILALGRHLHFEVIAEGVETVAQVEHLRRQGCVLAQGYYFSRPLPPAEIAPWLQRASMAREADRSDAKECPGAAAKICEQQ